MNYLDKEIEIRQDYQKFIEDRLYIKTKRAEIIKFKLNSTQKFIYNIIKQFMQKQKFLRFIILKSRQLGVSTFIQAVLFCKTTTTANTNTLIMAHTYEATKYLFYISKLFYEMLPIGLRPQFKYSTKTELFFENPNLYDKDVNPGLRSQYIVVTPDSDSGRAYTIHNLHASELAMWSKPEDTYVSLMQAIPDTPDNIVFLESTAKGHNFFYELWMRSKEKISGFYPIFCPWWRHEEYAKPLDEEFFDTSLDEYEKYLKNKLKLTLEQINWRRWCIYHKCLGNPERFQVEYPTTEEEAFLSTEMCFFPKKTISFLLNQVSYEPQVGIIHNNEFIPQSHSNLSIWKKPEPSKQYVIGADVASGIEEGDYSCIEVVCREPLEQVAEWHGHIDPDLLAHECAKIASYYNNALVGVEIAMGLTTLNELKKFYHNLYYWQRFDEYGYPTTRKLGWETNIKSRRIMLDYMRAAIRDGFRIYSKRLLNECLNFVYQFDPYEAEGTEHDDCVMAMAIALQMHEKTPYQNIIITTNRQQQERQQLNRIALDVNKLLIQQSDDLITQIIGQW